MGIFNHHFLSKSLIIVSDLKKVSTASDFCIVMIYPVCIVYFVSLDRLAALKHFQFLKYSN